MGFFRRILGSAVDEAADPLAAAEAAKPPDPMRWPRRIGVVSVLFLGWIFILWQNRFHVTLPVVVIGLAYLAVVLTLRNLWRTGAVAVAMSEDDERDSTWGSALGARGELEREKKALLRAIKEAEFDREMGKLSKQDCDEMIAVYRARAIEVIKDLDKLDAGSVGTVREQILREVNARLEIEAKTRSVVAAEPIAKVAADPDEPPGLVARQEGSATPASASTFAVAETAAAKAASAFAKTSAAVKAAKRAVEMSSDPSVSPEAVAVAKADAEAAMADAEAAMADANSAGADAERAIADAEAAIADATGAGAGASAKATS